jgi:hypothetical protein
VNRCETYWYLLKERARVGRIGFAMSNDDSSRPRATADDGVEASAGVTEEATIVLECDIPKNFISKAKWTRTELHFKGRFSGGFWARDDEGRLAVWKPGTRRQGGSTEAFREFVCAELARWLQIDVPGVLLIEDDLLGPCSICPHIAGTVLQYADVMLLPTFPDLRASAATALVDYIGKIAVLDAWVGAEDRSNDRNHVFVEETRDWHSLDYGLSFNSKESPRGVGDKDYPFVYSYLSDIKDAARLSRKVIRATITLVERVPDEAIATLVSLPPKPFATDGERRDTIDFLVHRKSRLTQILGNWWTSIGLPGAL